MRLLVNAPINGLSFGNVSVNILRELFKKNIDHALKISKEYDIIVCVFPHIKYWQDHRSVFEYIILAGHLII